MNNTTTQTKVDAKAIFAILATADAALSVREIVRKGNIDPTSEALREITDMCLSSHNVRCFDLSETLNGARFYEMAW